MSGRYRILAPILLAVIVIGIANVFSQGGGGSGGKPTKPLLWGIDEPPVLKNASWEMKGSIEMMELPKNLYGTLEEQLWALGYYQVYGNWSDCRWTIWGGKQTYYVERGQNGILVVRGSLRDVVGWVNGTSKYGKPGWATTVIGPSPGKALAYTEALIGEVLEQKDGTVVTPGEWGDTAPWSLVEMNLKAGDVRILVLIYATREQVNYARSLVGGRTLCITALGYYALIVLDGPARDVLDAYGAIKKAAEERNGLVFG